MSDEQPQIYLIAPQVLDPATFPDLLTACLDAVPVACIRLDLATTDEGQITKAADAVRMVAHGRDIPVVLTDHVQLAERLGLDGLHLSDPRALGKLRRDLGPDPILGAHASTSRHDGLTAAEAGADYVSFGPVGQTALGDGASADMDLFAWWSEMIEIPVVAEGALTPDLISSLAPITDFVALGPEVWGQDDPVAALKALVAPLALA